ncbi:MAG TPA: peptide ABC transporter substrate-binding protein [Chloroflexi bacterium]|nr:peptide ABC transporter substrate-binding protein [Chloroflexota bacterium]
MTRHIWWQVVLIVLGVLLVGILLAYLAVNYKTVVRPGHGGTYVEGIAGSPVYLNPLLCGYNRPNHVDHDLCTLLFRGLTRLNARGELEPDMAREWDVTLDGLTYTFRLRANAYWHDGSPVTADDVIFTINLLKDPNFPGPVELGASVWQVVEVEKVNRLTVRFKLPDDQPYAPFLDHSTVGLLPAHILKGIQAADLPTSEFNLNPIGCGPFMLVEIEVENDAIKSLVLEQFSRYYGDTPYLDRIQFRFYPSEQAVFEAYKNGQVEGIARVMPSDLSRAGTLPNLALYSARIARTGLVFLNMDRPGLDFFQESKVRQALMYALDRQRIIDEALGGQALVAHSPILPGTWAYKEDTFHYEYDPGQAGALLDAAGWLLSPDEAVRRKGGQVLAFSLLTSGEPERVKVAEMMAKQWTAAGIAVNVNVVAPMDLYNTLNHRDFDAVLVHLALPGDPDPYPFWHERQIEGGQNYAGFTHRRISEVIEQARIVNGREKRQALYDEFQELFAQEAPAVLLYVPVYTYGVSERIHGVQIGPLMSPADRFRNVSQWWIVPRRVLAKTDE